MARVAFVVLFASLGAAGPGAQELPAVLVSRQLAESRGIAAGTVVRLAKDARDAEPRAFRVAGIYEPTPDPMRISASKHEVRLHLPDLLALTSDPRDPLALENVQAVSIALVPGADPGRFAGELGSRLPGITARPTADAVDAGLFVVLERFHLAIAVVTIVASTVFLLALTVMLVDERRESVGVLRLIGFRASRILAQLFLEGLLIATGGAVFGVALAAASQGLINAFFQWRYDTALVFVRITPGVIVQCLVIAVPLGVAGTVIASWALLRRNALRLVRR